MKKFGFLFSVLAAAFILLQGFTKVDALLPNVKHSDTFDLNKYKGKIVVLNYWASWSKNSRNENKTLLHVYQTYKLNPKVVFVSISLDIDEASWKAAIEEDGLVWKDHFCDFKKYDSPMALKYGVKTLPKFIVFNASGKQAYSANTTHELGSNVSVLLK
jgi:thiol-disulfide isomerase/thioredoxin